MVSPPSIHNQFNSIRNVLARLNLAFSNSRYKKWLPDNVDRRHDTKTTYQVEIRYANNTNETFTFHGPPGADEFPGPVKWTRPYFDCGRSNRWLVAAVVPIADIYPRHTQFRHIEYPT